MRKAQFSCQRDDLIIRGHVFGDTTDHVVIISHGFLANEKTVYGYAKFLAEHGFLAITYDFNGGGLFSRSDGKSVNMTVLTEKQDLFAVIHAVRDQFHPKKISLMGCSQGGFVSALTARELGKQITSLIMFYPALCIPEDARKGRMLAYHFNPQNIPDILGRIPMKLGGDYARVVVLMNFYEEIHGYDGPVLLIHGTDDRIVNIEYSRKAKDMYASCEYHEIIGAGHRFRGVQDEEAKAFLKSFLMKRT